MISKNILLHTRLHKNRLKPIRTLLYNEKTDEQNNSRCQDNITHKKTKKKEMEVCIYMIFKKASFSAVITNNLPPSFSAVIINNLPPSFSAKIFSTVHLIKNQTWCLERAFQIVSHNP